MISDFYSDFNEYFGNGMPFTHGGLLVSPNTFGRAMSDSDRMANSAYKDICGHLATAAKQEERKILLLIEE